MVEFMEFYSSLSEQDKKAIVDGTYVSDHPKWPKWQANIRRAILMFGDK